MKPINANTVLRMADAVDSATADPLAESVEEKVLFPLIRPDTLMRFTIRAAELKTNDKTQNQQLVIKCATMKECQSTDNEVLHEGFTITHRINAKVTEKVTAKRIGDDIKTLCQACGIKGKTVRQILDDPSVLKDQIFDAKVGVVEDKTGQYDPQNSIRPIPLKS
jgi:hypothetical protein